MAKQKGPEMYLASTVHVPGGGEGGGVREIRGGRLVSELSEDESLSDDQVTSLRASGAIRPATAAEITASEQRAAAREAQRAVEDKMREVEDAAAVEAQANRTARTDPAGGVEEAMVDKGLRASELAAEELSGGEGLSEDDETAEERQAGGVGGEEADDARSQPVAKSAAKSGAAAKKSRR